MGVMSHPWTRHYDTDVTRTCGCEVCTGWRQAQENMQRVQSETEGHKHHCPCEQCTRRGSIAFQLRAATNKLDVVCEVAYHAIHNKIFRPHHQTILERLQAEIASPEWRSRNRWGQEAGEYPIGWWLRRVAWMPETSGAFEL